MNVCFVGWNFSVVRVCRRTFGRGEGADRGVKFGTVRRREAVVLAHMDPQAVVSSLRWVFVLSLRAEGVSLAGDSRAAWWLVEVFPTLRRGVCIAATPNRCQVSWWQSLFSARSRLQPHTSFNVLFFFFLALCWSHRRRDDT